MREIKFRGYAVEEMVNSQWLYGYGITKIEYTDGTNSVHLITDSGEYEVAEESVGQCVGLKDINGVEIYEGDILEYTFDNETKRDVVVYSGNMFTYRHAIRWSLHRDKVIGNIYENKDMLGE